MLASTSFQLLGFSWPGHRLCGHHDHVGHHLLALLPKPDLWFVPREDLAQNRDAVLLAVQSFGLASPTLASLLPKWFATRSCRP